MDYKTALRRIYFFRWAYPLRWAYRTLRFVYLGMRLLGDRVARKIVRHVDCIMLRRTSFDSNTNKMLLFTGHDVRYLTSTAAFIAGKSIWRYAAKKYAFLALDIEAADFCWQHSLPFFFPSDFMDEEELCEAFASTEAEWTEFIERCRPHAAVSGINWFAEDAEALYWYRKEVPYITALIAELRRRKFSELAFVRLTPPLPAVYYYKSSVWRELLSSNHPDIAKPIPVAVSSASTDTSSDASWGPLPELRLDGYALILLSAGEHFRFSITLKNLMRFCPRKYAVVLIGGTKEQAERLRLDFAVPVLSAPVIPIVRDTSIFSSFMEKIHELFQGEWKGAVWNLEFYTTIRWPSLLRWTDWWDELFRKNAIDVVIGSSLNDLETRIPFLTAKRHGILTFSLPHGHTFIPRENIDCAVDFFGAPSNIQKEIVQTAYPAVRYLGSPLIVLDAEYLMDRQYETDSVMTVVVIVKPSLIGESVLPTFSHREHILALQELKKMDGDIRVRFKTHPHYPERQLFAVAGIDVDAYVLPSDTNLFLFDPKQTVFITLNYMSGAGFHAPKINIPLITLNTSKIASSAHYARLVEEINGLVFSDPQDAISAARRLCYDQSYRAETLHRQTLFQAKYAPNAEDAKILYKVLMSSNKSKNATI